MVGRLSILIRALVIIGVSIILRPTVISSKRLNYFHLLLWCECLILSHGLLNYLGKLLLLQRPLSVKQVIFNDVSCLDVCIHMILIISISLLMDALSLRV